MSGVCPPKSARKEAVPIDVLIKFSLMRCPQFIYFVFPAKRSCLDIFLDAFRTGVFWGRGPYLGTTLSRYSRAKCAIVAFLRAS